MYKRYVGPAEVVFPHGAPYRSTSSYRVFGVLCLNNTSSFAQSSSSSCGGFGCARLISFTFIFMSESEATAAASTATTKQYYFARNFSSVPPRQRLHPGKKPRWAQRETKYYT